MSLLKGQPGTQRTFGKVRMVTPDGTEPLRAYADARGIDYDKVLRSCHYGRLKYVRVGHRYYVKTVQS